MILDSGICSIFRKEDAALSGEMPRPFYSLIGQGWFGELSFETSPARPTEGRQELKTDARIRILQNRAIRQHDIVVLAEVQDIQDAETAPVYRITRAYHGADESGATLISDLSLEVYEP